MDIQKFVKKIRRLGQLQNVTIKFKTGRDSITGLARLNGLTMGNTSIRFDHNDRAVVMAILSSRDWGHGSNRKVTVFGLSLGDEGTLAQIAHDVESIEHPDHPAKGITASREKRRQQALNELRDAVLPACQEEAAGLDLDLEFDVIDKDGFVVAYFTVKNGGDVCCRISVDGWSGRLLKDDQLTSEFYTGPEQIQQWLNKAILETADLLTAVA
ncbi:hypothetical protein CL630_00895 [bacterium]|jgi:hypothetical protein|nr:hypothetical protein [bacterium]|tara:strand:- start:18051 stop:18689 length:639 start_codon:yes stop_codon:yes gene_type:complete